MQYRAMRLYAKRNFRQHKYNLRCKRTLKYADELERIYTVMQQ